VKVPVIATHQIIRTPGNGHHTLVIMAKAPRPGRVKTRLARSLPVSAVTGLYRCLLDDTISLAQSLDGVEVAVMCPEADREDMERTVDSAVPVVPQVGSGLAAALCSVFAHFQGTGSSRIVAFNSDSPHLPTSILQTAFRLLEECDLVVGPTHDGGYYLVGAKMSHPRLFSIEAMGTGNALEELLAKARALELSVRFTDPFYDIDEAADLSRLAEELQLTPGRAPKTAKWLSEWARAQSTQSGHFNEKNSRALPPSSRMP
jgi:rSAM/selenodomain-associated transferase 1